MEPRGGKAGVIPEIAMLLCHKPKPADAYSRDRKQNCQNKAAEKVFPFSVEGKLLIAKVGVRGQECIFPGSEERVVETQRNGCEKRAPW